jgi:hypothetical protein
MKKIYLAVLVVSVLTLAFAGSANAGTAYTIGDVFVAVTGVGVNEYTANGTLVQTITGSGISSGFLTGMAFQSDGSLLVTNFSSTVNSVVQFDNSGTQTNATFVTGINSAESIAIDAAGHVYVSSVGGTGITEYNSTGGASIGTTIAGTRTDWIDLAKDQTTMLYSQEQAQLRSVTVGNNASDGIFSNAPTGGGVAAFRIIATGAFAGDILVSQESSGNAELLSADGTTVLKTYTGGGTTSLDFALNLDPNGTSFWTMDIAGHVAEFDIATGALLQSWNAAAGGGDYGLVVFGQQTASGGGGGGGGTVPEPGSLSLLVGGLITVGGLLKRRLVS